MTRYTIISTDCHAGPPHSTGGFRDYVESGFREQLERDVAQAQDSKKFQEDLFAEEFRTELDQSSAVAGGGREGVGDPARHLEALAADGVVAGILFPDGSQQNAPPFLCASGPGAIGAEHALQSVGAWAYNRWLADFVSHAPARFGGIAVMTIHDVDDAVEQVRWAREHGLRGVLLPAAVGELPFYHHPRYEPIWDVCEDLGMPLHTHVGSATPDYGDLPGSLTIFATESMWFSHRPLSFLIWGGVFERHPGLQVVFAEQGSDWVPDVLVLLDSMYLKMFKHEQKRLSLPPSEYWKRQCTVQSMFLSRREVALRHEIGIANMTWGSDYPHYEGSWPNSLKCLREMLVDVPESEIKAILSENAARIYGFDLEILDTLAAEIGPETASF
jgi:predicted TIM-barrel fold metal-dependent hydrolase